MNTQTVFQALARDIKKRDLTQAQVARWMEAHEWTVRPCVTPDTLAWISPEAKHAKPVAVRCEPDDDAFFDTHLVDLVAAVAVHGQMSFVEALDDLTSA